MIDYKTVSNDILKQINIVDVISHYEKVEKKGRNYTSLCPFHDDKKLGNFYISPDKQIFKCFACGKAGNAVNFVQFKEKCSYMDALRKVCEISGINDSRLGEREIKKIDPVLQDTYDCLTQINSFYSASLKSSDDGKEAIKYLTSRGLNDEIIDRFNIGYAQKDGKNIIGFLTNKGFSLKTIDNTGIARIDMNPIHDSNSGRITFAICNKDNQVVGFSARIFGDMVSDSKYINTRETKAFIKSKVLYNFYYAIEEARKVGYVYVLEGFMDVIAAYRADIKSAVALMGTALTREQIQLLRYLKCEIRLCLDLDGPGQSNMVKIISMFDEAGLKYSLVSNIQDVKGKDSDEILKNHGKEGLVKFLSTVISKGEWLLNYYSKSLNLSLLSDRKLLLNKFIPVLAGTINRLDYEDYLSKIISLSGFNRETIEDLIIVYKKKNDKGDSDLFNDWYNANKFEKKHLNKLEFAERQIMKYILENKEALGLYTDKLGYMTNKVYRDIISLIEDFAANNSDDTNYSVSNFISYLSTVGPTNNIQQVDIDEMIKEMSDIVINKNWDIPPYDETRFCEVVTTINEEREKARTKEAFRTGIRGKSETDAAIQAQNYLNKKREALNKNKGEKK